MSTEPDWTAAIADARRWLAHEPGDIGLAHHNMARCILAAHEERERLRTDALHVEGWRFAEWPEDYGVRGMVPTRDEEVCRTPLGIAHAEHAGEAFTKHADTIAAVRAEERAATERDIAAEIDSMLRIIKRNEDYREESEPESDDTWSVHRDGQTYALERLKVGILDRDYLPDPQAPRPAPTETAAAEPSPEPAKVRDESVRVLFEGAFCAWYDAACSEDYGTRGRLIEEATAAQVKAMAALVWPAPEPPPVEWDADDNAALGGVLLSHYTMAEDFGTDVPMATHEVSIDNGHDDPVRIVATSEETAKRLAIALAREMG